MHRGQLTVQGAEQLLAAGLEPGACMGQSFLGSAACDEAFDHSPCRLPMDVAHYRGQAHPGISEPFVKPVFLAGQHADQFLALPSNQTQGIEVLTDNETAA